jgi:hypothetical protein
VEQNNGRRIFTAKARGGRTLLVAQKMTLAAGECDGVEYDGYLQALQCANPDADSPFHIHDHRITGKSS